VGCQCVAHAVVVDLAGKMGHRRNLEVVDEFGAAEYCGLVELTLYAFPAHAPTFVVAFDDQQFLPVEVAFSKELALFVVVRVPLS